MYKETKEIPFYFKREEDFTGVFFMLIAAGLSPTPFSFVTFKNFIIYSSTFSIIIAHYRKDDSSNGNYECISYWQEPCGTTSKITLLHLRDNFLFVALSDGSFYKWLIVENDANDLITLESCKFLLKANKRITSIATNNSSVIVSDLTGIIHLLVDDQKINEFNTGNMVTFLLFFDFHDETNSFIIVASLANLSFLLLTPTLDAIIHSQKMEHKDWITSMVRLNASKSSFATCSQDRSIRIFSISKRITNSKKELLSSNKKHFSFNGIDYILTNVNVLYSHEDVVTCLAYHNGILLSSSLDRSVIEWTEENDSSSSSDNSFTLKRQLATGSGDLIGGAHGAGLHAGPFGVSFFGTNNCDIICNLSTGSLVSVISGDVLLSGHIERDFGSVQQVLSLDDDHILSVGRDKTARIFSSKTLKELARPQVHGYELQNALLLDKDSYISCAQDEKIIRIFKRPRPSSVFGGGGGGRTFQPALQLSNREDCSFSLPQQPLEDGKQQIIEEYLNGGSLWIESDKLYGHGNEISAMCLEPREKKFLLTSSKVLYGSLPSLFLWEMVDHHHSFILKQEITTILPNSLSIVSIDWSPFEGKVIITSRDRWVIVVEFENNGLKLFSTIEKAHSRIIWSCKWISKGIFVTSGRDRRIKWWKLNGENIELIHEVILCAGCKTLDISKSGLIGAGTDDGKVLIIGKDFSVIEEFLCSGEVNSLQWFDDNSLLVGSSIIQIFNLSSNV